MADDKDLKKAQLTRAYRAGNIAAITAINGKVRFVYNGGVDTGTLLSTDGSIKIYSTDTAAWAEIDRIKDS